MVILRTRTRPSSLAAAAVATWMLSLAVPAPCLAEDAASAKAKPAKAPGGVSRSALDLARARVAEGDAFTLTVRQPRRGSPAKPTVTVTVGDHQALAPAGPPPARARDREERLDETGPEDPVRSLIDMSLGPSIITRSFDYSNSPANSSNLRSYKLPGIALMEAQLALFPAVGVDLPVVADLGVRASYGHSIDIYSLTSDGRRFLTHTHRWQVGLLYRRVLSSDERLRLNAELSFAKQEFSLDAQDTRADLVSSEAPNVDYHMLRPHVSLGYAFDPLTVWFGMAYLGIIKGGPIYDQFRDASLHGLDIDARVDVTLGRGFGLRISSDYRRVVSAFSPEVGDAFVAGGAAEQLIAGHAAIRYVH